MAPYYLLIAVVAVLCLASQFTQSRLDPRAPQSGSISDSTRFTFFDYIALTLLVVFSGMRYSVGTDFNMYARLYVGLLSDDYWHAIASSPQEIGYTSLAFLLGRFSESPALIFWVTSILTVVPIYVTLKKKSANMTLSVLLYILLAFYVSPFNIVRQGVAIALNFFASRYVHKNLPMFIALNALAATFHSSVIFVALLQWLSRKMRPSIRMLALTLVGSGVMLVFLGSASWAADFVALLNPRYETYIDGSRTAGAGTVATILVSVALVVYSLSLNSDNDEIRRYQTYMILGLPFLVAGIAATPIARLQYYFSIFVILALPNQLRAARNFGLHAWALTVGAVVYFTFFLAFFGGLVPYRVSP